MTNSEHIPNGQVSDACQRVREILDYFDAEADEALANESERGDLWSDIEIPVGDLRTMLDALTRRSSAGVKGETKIEAQPIHALPMPPYDFQGNAALTPSPTLEPTDAEVERAAESMFNSGGYVIDWVTALGIACKQPESTYVQIVASYRHNARAALIASRQSSGDGV